MRTLLDVLRENKVVVKDAATHCLKILDEASEDLRVLDPETGNAELSKSWAGELAQLRRG